MASENTITEYKSLRKVQSGDSGFRDLSVTCVCLANTQGGQIIIGIEDKDKLPPVGQTIDDNTVNTVITRLRSLCFNVSISHGGVHTHENGAQYFIIDVHPSLKSIATTNDGKIYTRIGDECQPARSEDIIRIASEKDSFQWELQSRSIPVSALPALNIKRFAEDIRLSPRVKSQIKALTDLEIAEHYNLIIEGSATNLGVLWLGNTLQRNRLVYPLTVQYIVYDEHEAKVRKVTWHDNDLNPKELLQDIEQQAIELTYFDELPNSLFRKSVRHYDPEVLRELIINAIAHKSFSISGDIFIKVFPDRLEISNPGGLPLGVTSQNILHSTKRRNPFLIRILHDLELMEGEGSGYNRIYELNSRLAKPFPIPVSAFDSVTVTQSSKTLSEEVIKLLDFIDKHYHLTQKEFIVLGVITRHKKLIATQLVKELQLTAEERLRSYLSRLIDDGVLITTGTGKGTAYLINPKVIAASKVNIKPSLKTIEQPRLKALIEETLKMSDGEGLTMRELHAKLEDVPLEEVQNAVYKLVTDGILEHGPGKTYRKYWLAEKNRTE